MKKLLCFTVIFIGILLINNKTYAYKEYNVGDEVLYNRMKFYVIKNSSSEEKYVVLLKKKPLTVNEINNYGGVGSDNNHVNKYTKPNLNKSYNNSGYGGMAYYTSETCGYINDNWVFSDCKSDYAASDIKYVVDNWLKDKFDSNDLIIDSTGYSGRLLTIEELRNNLGYGNSDNRTTDTPSWLYNLGYYGDYWTMSSGIWVVSASSGWLHTAPVHGYLFSSSGGAFPFKGVRPVVNIKKESLNKVIDDKEDDKSNENYNSPIQESYKIGDEVIYKGQEYHVIKDNDSNEDYVNILKDTPLTVAEVNKYGKVGTKDNHININVTSNEFAQYYQEAFDLNGYGGMAYYTSDTCDNSTNTSCTTEYDKSNIKYVVDAWAKDKFGEKQLKDARLITADEFTSLSDVTINTTPSGSYNTYNAKYDWLYNNNYTYWTMSGRDDTNNQVNVIGSTGDFENRYNSIEISAYRNVVRPVVELYTCALDNSCVNGNDEVNQEKDINKNDSKIVNEVKDIVSVPNTLKKLSVILTSIGVVAISVSLIILIKNKDKISTK